MGKYTTKYGTFFVSENDKKIVRQFEQEGGHQNKEIAWVLSVIEEGIILDVGAHIGTFTVPLSEKGPVFAVEPHPHTAELLARNIAENNIKNVKIFQYGVSSREGSVYLAIPKNDGGARLASAGEYKVKTVPLDYFYQFNEEYALIKIDVEGQEYEVLRSGSCILSHNPPIFFEVGENTGFLKRIKIDWLLRKYVFFRLNKQTHKIEKLHSTLQMRSGDVFAVPRGYTNIPKKGVHIT